MGFWLASPRMAQSSHEGLAQVLPNARDPDDREEKALNAFDDVGLDQDGFEGNFIQDFQENLEKKRHARQSLSLLALFFVSLVVGVTRGHPPALCICVFVPGSETFIAISILCLLFTAVAVG